MTFFPDLFYVIKFILLCRKKRDGDGDTVSLNEMALSAAAENGSSHKKLSDWRNKLASKFKKSVGDQVRTRAR